MSLMAIAATALGAVLLVAGVALLSIPAGAITAGLILLVFGLTYETDR